MASASSPPALLLKITSPSSSIAASTIRPSPPFRPFVLRGDGFYYAGVIYHHWVADSVSIRTVLREWFVRLFDPKNSIHRAVQLADGGYRRFFSILRSGTAMGQGLLTATRW